MGDNEVRRLRLMGAWALAFVPLFGPFAGYFLWRGQGAIAVLELVVVVVCIGAGMGCLVVAQSRRQAVDESRFTSAHRLGPGFVPRFSRRTRLVVGIIVSGGLITVDLVVYWGRASSQGLLLAFVTGLVVFLLTWVFVRNVTKSWRQK